jgi:peptide chain release factor 3
MKTISDIIKNRRTFAIISHPDAGKTTLTEKLLLYGNAIDLAGNVRARRNQRTTTSDWMEMERERGISITSTVLQFPYREGIFNLLDTPGHQDFSEDTYRTLAAVDSAIMLLDAAKGIEPQTRRLFEVCRQRGIPIFTFINKLDRPARQPLALLDEIEDVLGLEPVPLNWPVGDGDRFRGIYDRHKQGVYLYERVERNERMAPETFYSMDSLIEDELIKMDQIKKLREDIQLLDGLGITFDYEKMLAEKQTPVFFASALTNFGVRPFLESFAELAPPPQSFESDQGWISPEDGFFSGFVFKIQANMNPKHHDSVAFVRVCSGEFERGMDVVHVQSDRDYRLQRSYKLFANQRETIEKAYPGDVIGLPNAAGFAIGDTLSEAQSFKFNPIPRFHPEFFATIHNLDLNKHKQFHKGLRQLETEGAVQILFQTQSLKRDPVVAVVGVLQFDVVQARMENEYHVPTSLEHFPNAVVRWVTGPEEDILRMGERSNVVLCLDTDDQYVALFRQAFYAGYAAENYPMLNFEMKN